MPTFVESYPAFAGFSSTASKRNFLRVNAQMCNLDKQKTYACLQNRQELDTAIEQCYRLQPFKNDTERLEYLFKQYEEMLLKDTLFAKQKKRK